MPSNLKQTQKGTNLFVETFSTTFSSSKHKNGANGSGPYYSSRVNHEPESKNKSQESVEAKMVRQPSMPVPLKSTDIVRNIHTVKRSKRFCPTSNGTKRFYKIKSCHDIHSDKIMDPNSLDENTVKSTYKRFDNVTPFLSNPIEVLRQERLRRERLKQQKLQKEKEKLKLIDRSDISLIEPDVYAPPQTIKQQLTDRSEQNKQGIAELDYKNIKMKI